jgi:hypothetical protein
MPQGWTPVAEPTGWTPVADQPLSDEQVKAGLAAGQGDTITSDAKAQEGPVSRFMGNVAKHSNDPGVNTAVMAMGAFGPAIAEGAASRLAQGARAIQLPSAMEATGGAITKASVNAQNSSLLAGALTAATSRRPLLGAVVGGAPYVGEYAGKALSGAGRLLGRMIAPSESATADALRPSSVATPSASGLTPAEQTMLDQITANNARLDAKPAPLKGTLRMKPPEPPVSSPAHPPLQVDASALPDVPATFGPDAYTADRRVTTGQGPGGIDRRSMTPMEAVQQALRQDPSLAQRADAMKAGGVHFPASGTPILDAATRFSTGRPMTGEAPVAKVPIADIATKSGKDIAPWSPEFTGNDLSEVGLNPQARGRITGMRPDVKQQLMANRAARHGAYQTNKGMDATARAATGAPTSEEILRAALAFEQAKQ